jgi:hypothetical protein
MARWLPSAWKSSLAQCSRTKVESEITTAPLRLKSPSATAGVALVGASIIAATPPAAPLPEIQMRPVKLVDAWSELIANTTANYEGIVSGADAQAISEVLSQLTTNPSSVVGAL